MLRNKAITVGFASGFFWFLAWLVFRIRRYWWYVPPKRQVISKFRGVMTQKTVFFKGVNVYANLYCSGSSLKGDEIRGFIWKYEVICVGDFGTRFTIIARKRSWRVSMYCSLQAITCKNCGQQYACVTFAAVTAVKMLHVWYSGACRRIVW
jgi:hypothetical protein